MTEHRFTLRGVCPADGSADAYNCVVRTERVIPIEEILGAANALTELPIYQENLTRLLADDLHAEVETHGVHSGVYTSCRFNGSRA